MKVIQVTNVNQALSMGLEYLLENGVSEASRNGPVLVAPVPVVTAYSRPLQRVLFSPERNANPFFHLMEALWMLAGRNDLAFPKMFNSKFGAYSDDGLTVRGAYGYRWREWFGYDQLGAVAKELIANPLSRRCVLGMWDAGRSAYDTMLDGNLMSSAPPGDLLAETVDKPCNTHIYFRVNEGKLDITVCCRSNDVLWGAYGANVVHMSILQEYMAAWIGIPVGVYYQMSNNFHLYTTVADPYKVHQIMGTAYQYDYYRQTRPEAYVIPLVDLPIEQWTAEVVRFVSEPEAVGLTSNFLHGVAQPMALAWLERKLKLGTGYGPLAQMLQCDWKIACQDWLGRVEANKASKGAL